MSDLTAERAHFLFDYNPETGSLKWRNPTARAVKTGDVAGHVSPKGYRYISIDHKLFIAHRVIWLMAYGELPNDSLVAKNGNYDDLRIDNFAVRLTSKPMDAAKREAWRKETGLRNLWARTRRDNPGDIGWKAFAEFRQSIGNSAFPHAHLVKIDATKPIGPDNFQIKPRAKFDRSTLEGRVAYYRDRSKTDRDRYRGHELLSKFGITLDQYREMLVAQKGVCAVCKQPETAMRNGQVMALSVDHCHATGAIRGLLCRDCNHSLGKFKDDPARFHSAANYIEFHARKQKKSAPASNVVHLKTKER